MRTTVLAALLLLCVQATTGNGGNQDKKVVSTQTFKYGDVIAFPRENFMNLNLNITHYGIYLDKVRFPGQQKEGENLFHITGPFWGRVPVSDCVFGKITDEIKQSMKVDNYLDNFTHMSDKIRVATEEQITSRITETLNNCKVWLPTQQNCEHLATYIRYGVSVSLQLGQSAEGKCRAGFWNSNKLPKDVETKILNELRRTQSGTGDEEYYRLVFTSPVETNEAPKN